MEKSNHKGLASVCLLLLALSASCQRSATSQTANASSAPLPDTVALVNNRPIPTKVYEMYLKNGREALGLDTNTEEGRRALEQLKEGIVSELIDRLLISQEAERRGISIQPDRLAEAERRAIAELGGEQKYEAYLAENHLTREEYRDVIKMEVYGELLRAELSVGLTVSDEEVKAYYDAHRVDAAFQVAERVTASHILVAARPNLVAQEIESTKNLKGEQLAAAVREEMERRRGRAEELRRKAASGADFAALARQNSDDYGTRDRGGDLGSFTRDSHTRAFDAAAFALKPGSVSSVVQTDFGFHIIKVSAHDEARTQTLAEATQEIRRRLLREREAARLKESLQEFRRKATVRINEPFRFGKLKDEFPAS